MPVTIKPDHRYRHAFVVGATGSGKTNLLKWFWFQDCLIPTAKILIDPSGSFAREAYSMAKNAIYCSLSNPIGINPLMLPYDPNDICDIIIESINQVIKLLTDNVLLTVRMRSILREAVVWCVRNNRRRLDLVAENINALKIHNETRQSIIDRINMFIQDDRLFQILCELPPVDWDDLIENKRTFIIDCHGMNDDKMIFVGTLITQQIKTYFRYTQKDEYKPLVFYADECHNFVNPNTFTILREARKYKISAILATTDFAGLDDKLVHTILSNCGTLISFRCGFREAVQIAREFKNLRDIQFLEKHYAAVKTPDFEGSVKTQLSPFVKKKPITIQKRMERREFGFKWFALEKSYQPNDDSDHHGQVFADAQEQGAKTSLSKQTAMAISDKDFCVAKTGDASRTEANGIV